MKNIAVGGARTPRPARPDVGDFDKVRRARRESRARKTSSSTVNVSSLETAFLEVGLTGFANCAVREKIV